MSVFVSLLMSVCVCLPTAECVCVCVCVSLLLSVCVGLHSAECVRGNYHYGLSTNRKTDYFSGRNEIIFKSMQLYFVIFSLNY